MKSVFFYGLFMDQELLKAKGLNPANPRLAHVNGYGLRIDQRATLVPSSHEQVHGVIMDLDVGELDALYRDASVADYTPTPFTAFDQQGSSFGVLAYILPMNQVSGSNLDYAGQLARVARKLGLPAGYIEEIDKWAGGDLP